MIKTIVLIFALVIQSWVLHGSSIPQSENKPTGEPSPSKVGTVIVGAGLAGLAAASRLIENGHKDILILEAQDRIGGRIYTGTFGGKPVEIGAQWIHGEEGNAVYDIAEELDQISYRDVADNEDSADLEYYTFYKTNGERVPRLSLKKWHRFLDSLLEEDMNKFNGSLGQFLTERVEESLEKKPSMASTKRAVLDTFMNFQGIEDGSDSLFEVSAQAYGTYEDLEGSQSVTWKKRYDMLIDYFLGTIPEGTIKTGSEVTNINYNDGVTVTLKNGDKVMADRVIVTVSLGVLKAIPDSFFTPSLPEKKKVAISSIGFGAVDKIYIKFPEQWWPDYTDGFCFLWPENQEDMKPELKELESTWARKVFGFDTVSKHPNVLCGWASGESARIMEDLTEEQVAQDSMKLLRGFLGDCYDIPEPVEFFRSRWANEPHVYGAYSFLTAEAYEHDVWPEDLGEPLKDGKGNEVVLFAGEATNPTHFQTAHGAIETGWREADRIIKKI